MPNHVVNEIRLHNIPVDVVAEIATTEEAIIDFSKLLPLPLNFWPGSVSIDHEEAFPGTHLQAERQTWGTKWNAYALGPDSLRQDGSDTVLTFETAWSPPRGWVVAVFSRLKCKVTHCWNDEGQNEVFVETYTYDTSQRLSFPKWETGVVEAGSEDYRRIYKLQWGVETPEELASKYS